MWLSGRVPFWSWVGHVLNGSRLEFIWIIIITLGREIAISKKLWKAETPHRGVLMRNLWSNFWPVFKSHDAVVIFSTSTKLSLTFCLQFLGGSVYPTCKTNTSLSPTISQLQKILLHCIVSMAPHMQDRMKFLAPFTMETGINSVYWPWLSAEDQSCLISASRQYLVL